MARQPRIVYEGAYYHVMARGNQRQEIVRGEEDREMFLATLEEAVEKTGWEVLAFVLMGNHYHLVMRTPEANLVEGMKWFQNTYTRRFAVRHKAWGHLYGGRYKAIVVDPEEEGRGGKGIYLPAVMDYVHLNPVRAGLVDGKSGMGLLDYGWSSLALGYGRAARQRAGWLAVGAGLAIYGLNDTAADRKRLVGGLEERVHSERRKSCGLSHPDGQSFQSTLQRGWYWGRQEFGEALARKLRKPGNRTYRSSRVVRERNAQRAGELLAAGLAHFGLQEGNWSRANYRARAAIAWALARKSSAAQGWIAERLGLRNAANVSQLTRRFEREMEPKDKETKAWIKSVKNC